ncbi:MAG: hypothetical protein OXU71_12535 [Gammaproteobacteria bacterium]|nr:hypothetical protein [Gammaproteobacteria bacterium]
MNIIDQIKKIPDGEPIPKPESEEIYTVKGVGRSRGEDALVYRIPGTSGSTKRVPFSAFIWAEEQLACTGKLLHTEFSREYPKSDNDGDCNFTTLGGVFVLFDKAEYESRGVYCKKGN